MCELENVGSSSPAVEMDERNGDLFSLPEDVIGSILSLTTPSEAGRSSVVCRSFNAAAQSDVAWNSFLPSDTDFIISLAEPNDLHFDPVSSSRKQIFLSLCRTPLLFHDRTKSLSLEKWSGKKIIMYGARGIQMNINNRAGKGNTWRWEHHPNSRFGDVAVLASIPELSTIRGTIDHTTLDPRTYYAAYIVFNLVGNEYTGKDINIHNLPKDNLSLRRADDHSLESRHRRELERRGGCPWLITVPARFEYAGVGKREDGWFEIELPLFEGGNGYDISIGVLRKDDSQSCFVFEGIEFRPLQNSNVRIKDAKNHTWMLPTSF